VKEPMGLTITRMVFGYNGILAAVSTDSRMNGLHYLNIWQRKTEKTKDGKEITSIDLKTRLEYNGKILGLELDRNFITVAIVPATEDEKNLKIVEFRFIDARTLIVGFCMKIDLDEVIVGSGEGLLVFLNLKGSVR
jgi:hypothetical protein